MIINKKIIVFAMLLILSVGGLIMKDKMDSDDSIYVLSEEGNSNEKENEEQNDEKNNNEENNITKENKDENILPEEVTVYISGAVKTPGIVTVKKDDRLATAVEKVGGATEDADLNQVNMAVKLEDEKHYIIPKEGEIIENISEVNTEASQLSADNENKNSKININSATIEELDTLPGVGEATANKILNYRNESGKFNSIEEIKNVNGIGDKKYQDLKELISVD